LGIVSINIIKKPAALLSNLSKPYLFDGLTLSKHWLLLFLVVSFILGKSRAQEKKEWSTNSERFEDVFNSSFREKPKIDFKFDSRWAFVRNEPNWTLGVKFGVRFSDKFKLGLGYNRLIIESKSKIPGLSGVTKSTFRYGYISQYIEYAYFTSRRWEFNLSLQVGLGTARYEYVDEELNRSVQPARGLLISYEPAMLIDYKVVRFIGIGTGLGYRLTYHRSAELRKGLTSLIWLGKLKVYLGEIARTVGKKKKHGIDSK